MLLLWEDLSTNHGFQFITNRKSGLCRKYVKYYNRKRGEQTDNPNPERLRAALWSIFVDQLLTPSKSSNCQVDLDKILLHISFLAKPSSETIQQERENIESTTVSSDCVDLICFITPENDNITLKNIHQITYGRCIEVHTDH